MIGTLTLDNPYSRGGSNHYKGQLHIHSNRSTDGVSTPVQVATALKNAGYHFYALPDHDQITPDPGVAGITWLGPSVEEHVQPQHVLAFNANDQSTSTDTQTVFDFHYNRFSLVAFPHPYDPYLAEVTPGMINAFYHYHLMEIYNGFLGMTDYNPISSVNLWDTALSWDGGRQIWGFASDDTKDVNNGFNLGWIIVNANSNTAVDILGEIAAGNFYASTGNDITVSCNGATITAQSSANSNFKFIGKHGTVLQTNNNCISASYTVVGNELYVRVESQRVSDTKMAWSQPVFLRYS